MKFPHIEKLRKFIKEQQIFADCIDIKEIYTGGSSYNFYIQTKHKKYFLKLLKNGNTFHKIKELSKLYNMLYPTTVEDFLEYKILVMPYIEGHKIRYRDCSLQFWSKLVAAYQTLQFCHIKKEFIGQMYDMQQICAEVEGLFRTQKSMLNKFLYKNIWQRLKTELISLPDCDNLIHGDFTANNIIISPDNQPFIMDWEKLRYGYMAEDMASLVLELSGFRGLYGRVSRFLRLKEEVDKHFSITSSEWLYGMQLFYINLLLRRINRKKQSVRKQICLWLIMRGYFRICKFLQK